MIFFKQKYFKLLSQTKPLHDKLVGEFERFLETVKQEESEDQKESESENEVEQVTEPKTTKEKKKITESKLFKSKRKSSSKKAAAKVLVVSYFFKFWI